ncbi:MAG TPA: prepilin peptidase, partial [Bacillota bacterium]|nr:prepilin peptidase [Bacillota bacterium]
ARPNKAVGGADIKISTAAAFLLGAEKGILALIIGMSIAVIVMLIVRKLKKADKSSPFPLVPFLSVGIMAAYII